MANADHPGPAPASGRPPYPLAVADCDVAALIMEQAYDNPALAIGATPWSAAAIRALLTSQHPGFGLALGRPMAGFLLARSVAQETELLAMAVKPENHRMGIARQLLGQLISGLKQEHSGRIFLEVSAENHPAIQLYRYYGFEKIGIRPQYYGKQDALIMACNFANLSD